jgi:hypothetical protein
LADVATRGSGQGVDYSAHAKKGIDHVLDPTASFPQERIFSAPQITNIEKRAIHNEAEG